MKWHYFIGLAKIEAQLVQLYYSAFIV